MIPDIEKTPDWIVSSQRHMIEYKRLEQEWRESYWNETAITDREQQVEEESPIFGQLEQLDISLIGNRGIRLEGCLATIAWLNG